MHSINETGVENFDFVRFNGGIYPDRVGFPIPKPGTPIPITRVYLYDTTSDETASELRPSAVSHGSLLSEAVSNEALLHCRITQVAFTYLRYLLT